MTSFSRYKGSRDFYPDDWRQLDYLKTVCRSVAVSYGYEAYEAPLLEPLELYQVKAQTNQEIINRQIYRLVDASDRQLALRPEMTPSLARMVVAHQSDLSYPLRWYSWPRLWRYEQPQRGRLREHFQFNLDLIGIASTEAEFELIMIISDIFKRLGAADSLYKFHINSRPLLEVLLSRFCQLEPLQVATVIQLIDRRAKEPDQFLAGVNQVLQNKQRQGTTLAKIKAVLAIDSFSKLPEAVKPLPEAVAVRELLAALAGARLVNYCFDPAIVRGFDYYTGIVFEVFDQNPDNNRSLAGGGRYDNLIEAFGGSSQPAAGFGLGDVTLANFCTSHQLTPKLRSQTDILVALIDQVSYASAWSVIASLRAEGLNVVVDNSDRRLGKKIAGADKQTIAHVVFIGPEELQKQLFRLKHLDSGQEQTLSLERLISTVSARIS